MLLALQLASQKVLLQVMCQCMNPQSSLIFGLIIHGQLTMHSSNKSLLRLMLLAWKGLFRSTNDMLPACLAGCAHQTPNKIWALPKAQFNLQPSSVMYSTCWT